MAQDSFQRIRNDYKAGNPVSNEMFFGREQELSGIYKVLNQSIKKVIRLRGRKRSGKTSILKKVGHDIKEKGIGYGIFCDFQDIAHKIETNDDLPSEIGKAIIKMDEFDNFSDDFLNGTGDRTEKLERLIKECLRKISPRKLIFLCDEYEALNTLFEPQKHSSEPLLTSKALKWADNVSELPVYFIMAGSEKFGRILKNKLEVHTEEIKIDTLLSYEATKDLIEKPVKNELMYDEAAIKRIYRLSGGHPFYVQHICKVIVDEVNATLHCRRIEKGVLDKVIDLVIHHPPGYVVTIWKNEIYAQSKNILCRLADMLQDADENEYRKPNKDIFENQEVIKWLKEHDLIEQRDDDKAVRFTIDIFRHWIQYEFQHVNPDEIKYEDNKKQDDPKPIMKMWIPAIAGIMILLIIISVVFWVNRKPSEPIKKGQSQIADKSPEPTESQIADITGFEFIVCDYDERNIRRLYLLRKPSEKKLLLEKMKEPQKNPSISRDNQWLVFQSGGEDNTKIIVANLRMRKILGSKQGKMPSISPDGTKIVYIKDSSMLTMELKNNGDNVELSDSGYIELNRDIKGINSPVYLYNSKSIAFIGKGHRIDIFLYDPDDSFRDGIRDTDNRKLKKLSIESVDDEFLTASMNKAKILYSKNQRFYVKTLKIANEPEISDTEMEAKITAAFAVTDDIVSVKESRLVLWDVKVGNLYREISDFGLNKPNSIIPLKGDRQ